MKNLTHKFMAVIGVTAALISIPSQANTVITFDDPASNAEVGLLFDSAIPGRGFSHFTDGFTFTSRGGFMIIQDGSTPNSNGTNSLTFNSWIPDSWIPVGGPYTGVDITRTGGGVFDLISIDMTISECFYDCSTPKTIFANGSPIVITEGMRTFTLELTDVSEVTISGSDSIRWALDNVVAAVPVPEPRTYIMLLIGLGLIGFTVRRKKSTACMATHL